MNSKANQKGIKFFAFFILMLSPFASVNPQTVSKPLGKLVDISYAKMHINCTGSGSPTVILDAGAGGWSIHWFDIQNELSKYTRVCSYDRLGLGWSSLGEMPRSAKKDAADLHELLQRSGEKAPFVLAGHSYGGYIARVYYDMFPKDIAGMALIDSAHEKQWERLPVTKQFLEMGIKAAKDDLEKARAGRLKKEDYTKGVATEMLPHYQAQMLEVKTHQTSVSLFENIAESANEVGKTKKLDDLPLLVLSAGNSFAAFLEDTEKNKPLLQSLNTGWMEMQKDLAALSTNSEHLISQNSSHRFNRENPDLIVLGIKLLIVKIKKGGPTNSGGR